MGIPIRSTRRTSPSFNLQVSNKTAFERTGQNPSQQFVQDGIAPTQTDASDSILVGQGKPKTSIQVEDLSHSGLQSESRNPASGQESSELPQTRDTEERSSEAEPSVNPIQQEADASGLFRRFLGQIPTLEGPRQRMRSIETTLSQKSLGFGSDGTSLQPRAKSIERSTTIERSAMIGRSSSMERSLSQSFGSRSEGTSQRSRSTSIGRSASVGRSTSAERSSFGDQYQSAHQYRYDDKSVGAYSSHSDPFRAKQPDQYQHNFSPPQCQFNEAAQYQSDFSPPHFQTQQFQIDAPLYESDRVHAPKNFSPLSWRLDPHESLSDWQIKVVRTDSGRIDIYHVHRMALAVGPRQSEYFADLFQKQVQDPNGSRLRLEMPDSMATVFPVVLDYMYGEDDINSVRKRKHAFAVYDQAEYFHMPGLKVAVANWFGTRLQWFDVPRYFYDIERFQDSGPLARVAVEQCASHFEDLGPQFAAQVRPQFLLQVLNLLAEGRYVFHEGVDYVAALVLESCKAHAVDREAFSQLTSNRFLPIVPPGIAIKLLSIDSQFADHTPCKLSCLQIRCIRSLARNWAHLCYEFSSAEAMADTLSHLPPSVLAQLLVRTASVPW